MAQEHGVVDRNNKRVLPLETAAQSLEAARADLSTAIHSAVDLIIERTLWLQHYDPDGSKGRSVPDTHDPVLRTLFKSIQALPQIAVAKRAPTEQRASVADFDNDVIGAFQAIASVSERLGQVKRTLFPSSASNLAPTAEERIFTNMNQQVGDSFDLTPRMGTAITAVGRCVLSASYQRQRPVKLCVVAGDTQAQAIAEAHLPGAAVTTVKDTATLVGEVRASPSTEMVGYFTNSRGRNDIVCTLLGETNRSVTAFTPFPGFSPHFLRGNVAALAPLEPLHIRAEDRPLSPNTRSIGR